MNKIISFIFTLFILAQPTFALDYDYSNTDCVKIPLRITEKITTSLRNKSYEGQPLTFIVQKDVYYNNKLLVNKGEKVTARLNVMMTRGFAGVPGEIYITDFSIPNLDNRKFIEPVTKRGFSTTVFILPLKWMLTPFPPFGSFTNIIIGGNSTLKPSKTIYLEYYPNYVVE